MRKNWTTCLPLGLLIIACTSFLQANASNQVPRRKLRSVHEYQQQKPTVTVHDDHDGPESHSETSHNFENVCDIQNPQSIYCYCDSLELRDAITVTCWIFGVAQPDAGHWEDFRSQPHLTELRIGLRDDGRLSFIPTRALTHLPKLEIVDVKYANISTIREFAFANLTKLEDLSLIRNQILTLQPNALANLVKLKVLTLSFNNISEINRDVFVNLPKLHELHLDNNKITILHDRAFRDLGELQELYMQHNQIGVITGDTFVGMKSLRKLDLRNNLLQILGDFTFVEVPELVEIDLQDNRIQYVRDNALFGLEKLEVIHLQKNNLVQLGEMIFDSTRSLRYIDLRNNRLDTLAEETWTPLWSNQSAGIQVGLDNNNFFCDCRIYWMVRLHQETTNKVLRNALGSLTCDDSRNLIEAVSSLSASCQPTTSTTEAPPPTKETTTTTTTKPRKFTRTKTPFVTKPTTEAHLIVTQIAEEEEIITKKLHHESHVGLDHQVHETTSPALANSPSTPIRKASVADRKQATMNSQSSGLLKPSWFLFVSSFVPWMLLHLYSKRTL